MEMRWWLFWLVHPSASMVTLWPDAEDFALTCSSSTVAGISHLVRTFHEGGFTVGINSEIKSMNLMSSTKASGRPAEAVRQAIHVSKCFCLTLSQRWEIGRLDCCDAYLDNGILDIRGVGADPQSDLIIGLLVLGSYAILNSGASGISSESWGWKSECKCAESQSWVLGPFEGPAIEFDCGYAGRLGKSRL